jgi:glycosyltransferase involved in cell wall biosynthesis
VSVEFSVVIPSFERRPVLEEVLRALDAQSGAPPFEIVVVDDGSRDGTAAWLRGVRPERPFRLIEQANRGPAAARNRGVAAAAGEAVAFLGDDTVPEAGWLAAHAAAHRRRSGAPIAVIGRIDWHPRMRPTPFLRHINENGLQFGFALIDDPENVPFNFFYTSNVSLGRAALLDDPFDERFPYPAWEDTEASYRMSRRGRRLVYEPAARVLHDHPTSFARFAARQEKAGYCAVVFGRLHPELGGFVGWSPDGPPALPSRFRQWLREGVVRALQFLPVTVPELWEETLRYHYIRGLRRGHREIPAGVQGVKP